MFSYSKDGLTVSYEGKIVDSILKNVKPELTVMDQGFFYVTIKDSKQSGDSNHILDDTRIDTITDEMRIYINKQLESFEGDVQQTGNKICEIYYHTIK